jgi:hypothetical protein
MTTHTTTNMRLTWRDQARTWLSQRDPIALGSMLIAAAIIGAALLRQLVIVATPAAAVAPTPQLPIIMIATQPAIVPPTTVPPIQVAALQPVTPRYVVAFAAPDGDVLGPIPAPATSALLGRWGDGWVATLWEDATVWIRAADIGLSLANLAPQIAPAQAGPRVVTVEQPQVPQVPQVPYQIDNQPAAPAQPAQPAAAPVVAPAAPATLVPMEQNDVTKEWARQQYAAEHPEMKEQP